jgi:hypothetical protein
MKCFVIGAIGIVSNSLQKYLETITGQHSIDSLQKTAILGTSHIIRKVLQAETCSLSGGVHHWLKRRSTRQERKPVTRDNNNNYINTFSEFLIVNLTASFHILMQRIVYSSTAAQSPSLCVSVWKIPLCYDNPLAQ